MTLFWISNEKHVTKKQTHVGMEHNIIRFTLWKQYIKGTSVCTVEKYNYSGRGKSIRERRGTPSNMPAENTNGRCSLKIQQKMSWWWGGVDFPAIPESFLTDFVPVPDFSIHYNELHCVAGAETSFSLVTRASGRQETISLRKEPSFSKEYFGYESCSDNIICLWKSLLIKGIFFLWKE